MTYAIQLTPAQLTALDAARRARWIAALVEEIQQAHPTWYPPGAGLWTSVGAAIEWMVARMLEAGIHEEADIRRVVLATVHTATELPWSAPLAAVLVHPGTTPSSRSRDFAVEAVLRSDRARLVERLDVPESSS